VVHLNELKGGAAATAHLLEFDSVQGAGAPGHHAAEGDTRIRIDDRAGFLVACHRRPTSPGATWAWTWCWSAPASS
jgi:hypothetical protein